MNLSLKKVKKIKIEKLLYRNLSKYNKSQEKICQNKIKNLMFHKKSHFTAIFTEYLIWDDHQEFLFELYPKRYSLLNISSFTKIQYNKFFMPIIINEWGRSLIKLNMKMKKLLILQITDKSKQVDPSKYILKKYSKILPSDISDNTIDYKEDLDNTLKTFKNFNLNKNNNQNNNNKNINQNIIDTNLPFKGKEISESESTIDNVNANNDISISLDLKINQKYDENILTQNVGFVIGKNGKNDEELLRMMKYLKPINTAYIYENNKNKLRANYIYLEYVNNKTTRLTETKKKSSKNKSENKKKVINNNNNINYEQMKTLANLNIPNKNIIHKNINIQKNNSKNTSSNKNKKKNEQKNNSTKQNHKLHSKNNNKVNNSKNNINSNQNNNNIINGYNDINNKTTSTKTNSYHTAYKNKSENRKPAIFNNRNKKAENTFITQHNSDIKVTTPFLNEPKILENGEKEIINIGYVSSKFGRTNRTSEENSKIQTITLHQKMVSNIKEKNSDNLKITNNISKVNNINTYGGEIKNFKRNNNKFLDISSDAKKMKFLISSKEENNNINKISGRKIVKKEKSLDNKPLNSGIYKPIISQISNRKNIIIVKRKVSEGINNFHKV